MRRVQYNTSLGGGEVAGECAEMSYISPSKEESSQFFIVRVTLKIQLFICINLCS